MDWRWITLVFLVTLLMQYGNHMVRCIITDVQLVGGPESNKGTIEIMQNGGEWETTCGVNLRISDVIVICRQLGFPGASRAMTTTSYGHNSTPYIGLDCDGSESDLSACDTIQYTWCSAAGSASCHGEGYLGCFVDDVSDRTFPGEWIMGQSMSIAYCLQFCKESTTANYTYAGVENGKECFCGKVSDNYSRHGVGLDENCILSCTGDPTESCGGIGYIAVFEIPAETSETTPTAGSTVSTEEIQEVTTQMSQMTNQPSSEMTRSTIDDLTSSPMATAFFSTLQQNSHSSCFGVGLGEGVVIILLSLVLIVLVIYIIRIRKMMKDLNKGQETQHVDLVQSSSSPEKDTGFYHDIQDVRKSVPLSIRDGDSHYSSKIYEQKLGNV